MAKYVIISDYDYKLSVKDSGTITFDTGARSGEVSVTGDFTVLGETTDIRSENVTIRDNILKINNGEEGAGVTPGSGTAGIEIDRGTEEKVQILFNENFQGEKVFNFQYANEDFVGIGTNLILTNGSDLRLITKGQNVVTVEGTENYEDLLLDYSQGVALNKNDDYITNLKSVTDFVHNFSDYYTPRQIKVSDTEVTISDTSVWEPYKIYVKGDIVFNNDSAFICNRGHTSLSEFDTNFWNSLLPEDVSTTVINVNVDGDLVSQWTPEHFDVFGLQVKDNILTTKSGTRDLILLGVETPNNVVSVKGTLSYEKSVLDYSTSNNDVAIPVDKDIIPNILSVVEYIGNHSSYSTPTSLTRGNTSLVVSNNRDWESYTIYLVNDIVTVGGIFYKCLFPHVSGTEFVSLYTDGMTPLWVETDPITEPTITVNVGDTQVSQWTSTHFEVFDLKITDNIITSKLGTDDLVLLGDQTPNNIVTVEGTTAYEKNVIDYQTSGNGVAIPFHDDILTNIKSVVDYIGNYSSYSTPKKIQRNDTSIETFDSGDWQPYSIYIIGDIVIYSGGTFRCLWPHISGPTFEFTVEDTIYWEATTPITDGSIEVKVDDTLVSKWSSTYFEVFGLKITDNIITSKIGSDNIILLGDQTPNNIVTVEGTLDYEKNVLDYVSSGNGVALPVQDDVIPNIRSVIDYTGNYASFSSPKVMRRGDTSISVVDAGDWAPYTIYMVNDVVNSSGSYYRCLFPHISSEEFLITNGLDVFWELTDVISFGTINVNVDDTLVSNWTVEHFDAFNIRVKNNTITTVSGVDNVILLGEGTNVVTVLGTTDYEEQILDYTTSGTGVAIFKDDDIIPNIRGVGDYLGNYYSFTTPRVMKRFQTSFELFSIEGWTSYHNYIIDDIIFTSGTSYKCVRPHTSSDLFLNDLIKGYWIQIPLPSLSGKFELTVDNILTQKWTSEQVDIFRLGFVGTTIKTVSGTENITLVGQGNGVVNVSGTNNYENQVLDYITSGNGVAITKNDDIIPNIRAVTDYIGNYFSYTTPKTMKRGDTLIDVIDSSSWSMYTNYIVNDYVIYDSNTYRCIKEHNSSLSFVPEFWEITTPIINGSIEVTVDNVKASTWTSNYFDAFGIRTEQTTISTVSGIDDITFFGSGNNVITVSGTDNYELKIFNYDNDVAISIDDDIIPNTKAITDYVGNYFSYTTPKTMKRGETSLQIFDFSLWTPYTNYIVDDQVSYNFVYYKCLSPHTSLGIDSFVVDLNNGKWELISPPEEPSIKVNVNERLVSTWTENEFEVFQLKIIDNKIEASTDNLDLILKATGNGSVVVESSLQLIELADLPEQPDTGSKLYSNEVGPGGTGIFYVNNKNRFKSDNVTQEPIRDELVSKRKAIAYSFIF